MHFNDPDDDDTSIMMKPVRMNDDSEQTAGCAPEWSEGKALRESEVADTHQDGWSHEKGDGVKEWARLHQTK